MCLSKKGILKRIIQGRVKLECDCEHLERVKLWLCNTKVDIMTAMSELLMFKTNAVYEEKKRQIQKQHSLASVHVYSTTIIGVLYSPIYV